MEAKALRGNGSSPPPPADLDIDPQELAQVLSGYLDQHYREALDDQIPLLDGKTPRQCIRTRQGRGKVIAWLKYLENRESRKANPDISPRIRDLRCSWRNSSVNRSNKHSDSYGLRRIFRNVKPDAGQNRIGQSVTNRNKIKCSYLIESVPLFSLCCPPW